MRAPPVGFNMLLLIVGIAMGFALMTDIIVRRNQRFPARTLWSELTEADVDRGARLVGQYGCGACHVIPGIKGANGRVGPKLEDLRNQVYIAGVLANVPNNLVLWIQHPQEVNPRTAMPTLGVTEEEARDIAAYLYSTR